MNEPIRVLHVVTYMGLGGLESMLMNYYRHIDRSKVQFDFLVHRDFKADYDDEILSLGGKIHHISRLVPWSGKYKNEFKQFLKAHPEYKIIHVHQDCLSAVALKCAKECGVPVRIAHSHNSNQDKNLKYLVKLFYMRKIPKYATNFFACGKEAGDWMFKGNEYTILRNAIDAESYAYDQKKADSIKTKLGVENKLVLGHVGRFRTQKNHLFLIDIFSAVHQRNNQSVLLLIGEGETQEETKHRVEEYGLTENVIFVGARSDVSLLMQAMDIFVFPSLFEGLPLTMIEAQSSSLPCVISDTIPDECILVPELVVKKSLNDDIEEWVNQILNTDLCRKNHIQQITNAGYNIKYQAQELQKFYLNHYK